MKKNVLLVDMDINHTNAVCSSLVNSGSIEVKKSLKTKQEAQKYYHECDVLVLDMFLDGFESVEILEEFRRNYPNKIIIATSSFISDDMIKILTKYNVNYFMKKPFNASSLEKIIDTIGSSNNKTVEDNSLKVDITNMLHTLGIPSHIKGYSYIREGVELLYKEPSLIGSITKKVYPLIASSHDTTASRVERAIRHAIDVSWMRGDYKVMEDIFGNSVDFDRSKPTNTEFIATIADRLQLSRQYV